MLLGWSPKHRYIKSAVTGQKLSNIILRATHMGTKSRAFSDPSRRTCHKTA